MFGELRRVGAAIYLRVFSFYLHKYMLKDASPCCTFVGHQRDSNPGMSLSVVLQAMLDINLNQIVLRESYFFALKVQSPLSQEISYMA